ncbi:MAG TPA: iron-sulfur cluster assembly scaffold protein [Anaerolineae bacterium]|jgi:nitrogen fixation NifU-like protein|nr:iron-sulfur cluster assembly scaffold protein [Anaerolineae bacterium]
MLTRQEQMELILDHYENPRHKRPLENAEAMVEGGNPGCGDVVKVYVRIDDGRIVASFEGEGCTISQASASYLMDEINGKTKDEALAIDHAELMDGLGKEIVQQRTRCATLSLDTFRAALRKRDREQMIANS